jgi:hypothetical protein
MKQTYLDWEARLPHGFPKDSVCIVGIDMNPATSKYFDRPFSSGPD